MEQGQEQLPTSNYKIQEDNSIKYRLDTHRILLAIESKLKGSYESYYTDEEGNIRSKNITVGKKLVNDEGLQKIMSMVSSVINNHTVLGFFKNTNDKNRWFLFWKKKFRKELFINKYNYGINNSSGVNHILIMISSFVDLFLSRLINRNEARALEKNYTVNEIINKNPKQGFFSK